jgi:hypothetical protein
MEIEGNFYGQDFKLAEREASRLNTKKNGIYYEVFTNMEAGGYQIWMTREADGEELGFYDDGNQWINAMLDARQKTRQGSKAKLKKTINNL